MVKVMDSSQSWLNTSYKYIRENGVALFTLLPYFPLLILPLFVIRCKMPSSSKRPTNLSDKVVVITGSANGIGEQLAYNFASLGAKLVLADLEADKLERVKEMCIKRGCPAVQVFTEDLTSETSCRKFILKVEKGYGKMDYLILNHATFQQLVPWEQLNDFALLEKMFKCNVLSYVYLTTHSLHLLEEACGSLVIMSSLVGKVPHPYLSIYASTKFALDGFFGSLKRELSLLHKSISITFIYLGSIGTQNARESLNAFNGGALNKIVQFCDVEKTGCDIMGPILEKWDACYYPFWTVKLTIFFNRWIPWLENYFTKKVFSIK